jgi:hypothetical protein
MAETNQSGTTYYPPQGEYTTFANEEDYAVKGREWGLFGKTSKKQFWYKNKSNQSTVAIKGYQEYKNLQILVIEFEDGQLSCIHPSFLKEMQSGTFFRELLSGETVGTEEVNAIVAEPESELVQPDEAVEQVDTVEKTVEEAVEGAPKKTKEKKEKPKKLDLPVDKVKFSAAVKEFTTKPNPFSDNDDEVLLFADVIILSEPQLVVGDAWCGYSNTLKGLELEVGDLLEFEGKIVDKKFNKEILYKVNNPSKINKR